MRSRETVNRHFNAVLKAVLRLHSQFLVNPQPVPQDCNDPRWKWFKDKEKDISTNVLGLCDRDMRFIYVLPGWEGSAADGRVLRGAVSREDGLNVPIGIKMETAESKCTWKFNLKLPATTEAEALHLRRVFYLEIIAPKWKSFTIKSCMKHIFFKDTPVLARVSLVTLENAGELDFPKINFSLTILHLALALKSLSAGGIPTRITVALIHLKVLKLTDICLDIMDEISFVLFLLRSSPNLKENDISVKERDIGDILDLLDYFDITYNELQEVKLQYISGTRPEMELIKILLERSPVLDKMLIQLVDGDGEEYYKAENKILKELSTYRRASRNVEVVTYYIYDSYLYENL
ncbi:hypothetical protein ACH5RR_036656 [Cinchona calisaya]|uniref:FBD domain-containing protein n=1 Tax=Cinchona calisaya TaxID=153742 RepID=A0ABD2Y707_9GENT